LSLDTKTIAMVNRGVHFDVPVHNPLLPPQHQHTMSAQPVVINAPAPPERMSSSSTEGSSASESDYAADAMGMWMRAVSTMSTIAKARPTTRVNINLRRPCSP
jgi:hypothetical protein